MSPTTPPTNRTVNNHSALPSAVTLSRLTAAAVRTIGTEPMMTSPHDGVARRRPLRRALPASQHPPPSPMTANPTVPITRTLLCSPRVLPVGAVRPRLLHSCSDLRRLLSAPRLSRPLRSDADQSRPLTRHATVLEPRALRRTMATQDLSLPMATGGAVYPHPTTTSRLLVPPRAGAAP